MVLGGEGREDQEPIGDDDCLGTALCNETNLPDISALFRDIPPVMA